MAQKEQGQHSIDGTGLSTEVSAGLKPFLAFGSKPVVIAALIFVVITLTLGFMGQGLAFVREDIMMLHLFTGYDLNVAKIFADGWPGLYGSAFPWLDWSYRPLEMLLDWMLVHSFGASEAVQIFFKSAVIGLLGGLIYLLMREITRRHFLAIASAFLVIFSVPMVIESWWYHHMIGYTEVVMLFGFIAYLRYKRLKRWRWLIAFWFAGLAAPLLGEYGVSLPAIVAFSLIVDSVLDRTKPDLRLLASAIILTFFGFYPDLLPNLLIAQRVVMTSILGRFVAGTIVEQGLLGWIQPSLPYFLIIGSLTLILTTTALLSLTVQFIRTRKQQPNLMVMGHVLLYILLIIFIRNYPPPLHEYLLDPYYLLPILFPVLFAILSYRLSRFLAIWFIISYLPFMRIHHLSFNLIPAMIPWTLLLTLWIGKLVDQVHLTNVKYLFTTPVRVRSVFSAIAVILVIAVLTIGIAAQISNPVITKQTWGESAKNTRFMGEFAAENFPEGSIILGEQRSRFEALDLSYYSQGKVQGNIVVYEDMWWPLEQIKAEKLHQFLKDDSTYTAKYFLIQENVDGALFRYLKVNPDDFELVGLFKVQSQITLIDPLYLIIPRYAPYFWGYMDVPYFMGLDIVKVYPRIGSPFYSRLSGWYSIFRYINE